MPCPWYSREEDDCRVMQAVGEDEEERGAPIGPDPLVDRRLCLVQDASYQQCAIYHRQVAESLP